MPISSSPSVTRRRFLVGGTAATGAILFGACGTNDSGSPPHATSSTNPSSLGLAQFFGGPMFVAGRELRAPFGVSDQDGLLPIDRTPEHLTVQLLDPDGSPHGDEIEVDRRSTGLPRAYFPLVTTLDEPGIYTVRTKIDGVAAEMSLNVDGPGDVKVIQVGAAMPAIETPTVGDARGVHPVCTRTPVCPLHDTTVAEALADGSPIGLLVASPAFCQVAICGPVLDVLLEVRDQYPHVRFLHAEVFAEPDKEQDTYAPVIAALGLHFEPCMVLVGADGTVVDRLDTIFDRSELRERLAMLS